MKHDEFHGRVFILLLLLDEWGFEEGLLSLAT